MRDQSILSSPPVIVITIVSTSCLTITPSSTSRLGHLIHPVVDGNTGAETERNQLGQQLGVVVTVHEGDGLPWIADTASATCEETLHRRRLKIIETHQSCGRTHPPVPPWADHS